MGFPQTSYDLRGVSVFKREPVQRAWGVAQMTRGGEISAPRAYRTVPVRAVDS